MKSRGLTAMQVMRQALSLKNIRELDRTTLLLVSTSIGLVVFGVVMVMSASSVTSYLANRGLWGEGFKQAGYALVALSAMLIAAMIKPKMYMRMAPWLFLAALLMQCLVFTPLGVDIWGNRNWLRLGPVSVQPSEFLKLGMILMLGVVITRITAQERTLMQQFVPVIMCSGCALLLIIGGRDLGTASVAALAALGCLLFGQLPLRVTLLYLGIVCAGALVLVLSSPNRIARILSFSNSGSDYTTLDWQPLHGMWALASGGITGNGLGSSKAKWSWLPAAENDYIFAIIGEETGLIGCVAVIVAYLLLAFAMQRLLVQARNNFQRTVVGGIYAWIIGQAFVNIAVVLRLFPVLGVPLPLVSAGGTALIACCLAIGVVISISREINEQTSTAATIQ